ncbi:hypothetical protein N9H57_02490 [Flavobacteriaceae bacterium]|nr:hypothetical protein [Flavobacteriaceae bacterium]
MKHLIYMLIFCLGLGFVFAQNQEDPEVSYRVEKEYDENGNLIRYDSTRVSSTRNLSKQFNFYFKKDSLGTSPHIRIFPHSFHLDSLQDHDSLFKQRLLTLRNKIHHLDSLLHLRHFPFDHNWLDAQHSNFPDLKKHLEAFEDLMQQNILRFEELIEKFEQSENQKTLE